MPIELGIIVKVQANPSAAGAVEISGKGSKDALEVRRTAGRVVPGIANGFSKGGIESQRIAVAIEPAVERHSGIDAVIESPLDDVGKLRVSRAGQHAPMPPHLANGRA